MKKSMEEKKKMPQIRFNGFNDDWEQLKLGELSSSFEYGLNAAAKEYQIPVCWQFHAYKI